MTSKSYETTAGHLSGSDITALLTNNPGAWQQLHLNQHSGPPPTYKKDALSMVVTQLRHGSRPQLTIREVIYNWWMDGSNITAFGKGNAITAEVSFCCFFERQTLRHRNRLFNLGHLRTSSQAIGWGRDHCVLSHGWLRKSHVASQNTMWLKAGAFLMGGGGSHF